MFFIYISCTNQNHKRFDLLNTELSETPILSSSFDSLWQDVQKLPSQQQVKILLKLSCRDEKEMNSIKKLESILSDGLSHASMKEKKKMLLQLLRLYKKLNEQRDPDADVKGIKLCKKLYTDFSLSKEEKWEIMKIKAILLSKRGLHEQYLPIWFELLAEHRTAGKIDLVIEDLFAIANHLAILGDREKGIIFYKEAYQLARDYQFQNLRNKGLIRLLYLFYYSKQYSEVVNYSDQIDIDSFAVFMPSVYSLLSTCHLELKKTESARLYLAKMDKTLKKGNGMILNCRMADTYIAENNLDSALVFLNKAMSIYKGHTEQFQKKNIKTSLPFNFLPTCSALGSLYQQSGEYQQAANSFTLVEPLMTKTVKEPFRLEMQIDALTRYSTFCRNTKQYKKAVDLMVYRDSIQQIVNKTNKKRDNKNLMDRLQISDLMHTINMKEIQLANSKRWLIAISCCAFLAVFLITAIIYIIYQHRKQKSVIVFVKNEKKHLQSSTPLEDKEIPDAVEQRFLKIQDRVISEQLFLDKEVTLKSLAKILNTNRSNLSAWINTYAGVNFNQWINDFRINYMLERIHSGKKISKLAEEAGFISSDSFYRNFKRKTNLTPTEYLKQNPPR